MKNPKFQPPTAKGIPDSAPRAASGDDLWGLRFGVSLVLGVWCLVLFPAASAFWSPPGRARQNGTHFFERLLAREPFCVHDWWLCHG